MSYHDEERYRGAGADSANVAASPSCPPCDCRPHPEHPIVIPPDAIAPGVPTHPIVLPPPIPAHPIVIPPGSIGDGKPEHPIVLPPFRPEHPIVIPPDSVAPGVPAHPIVIPPVVTVPPPTESVPVVHEMPEGAYQLVWLPGAGYLLVKPVTEE